MGNAAYVRRIRRGSRFGIMGLWKSPVRSPTRFLGSTAFAVSPFHVHASRDLKDASLISLTAVLAVFALYQARVRNRRRDWAIYVVFALVESYSDIFAAPLIFAANLWFMLSLIRTEEKFPRKTLTSWFISNSLVVIAFLPYFGVMLSQARDRLVHAESYLQAPNMWAVAFYLKTIAFGYSDRDPLFKIAMVFFGVVGLVGAWDCLRTNRKAGVLLVFWFVVPVALVYTVSVFFRSIFLTRAMLPFTMPAYIWCGATLARCRARTLQTVLMAGFVVFAFIPILDEHTGRWPLHEWPHRPGVHAPHDYRSAAKAVREAWQPGDVVCHASGRSWFPFYWYGFRELPQYVVSPDANLVQYVLNTNPSSVRRPEFQSWFMRLVQPTVKDASRIWFVSADWGREYSVGSAAQTWRWFDTHYIELDHTVFGDYDVFLYARDVQGLPIEVVQRDQDDGLHSVIHYRGGIDTEYRKVNPDFNLIPRTEGERRGPLTLCFEQGESAARTDQPVVRFLLENRSEKTVSGVVMMLCSVDNVDLSSLHETAPERAAWRLAPLTMDGTGDLGRDISTWQFQNDCGSPTGLYGSVILPEESVMPVLFCRGDMVGEKACANVQVAGETLSFSGVFHVSGGWVWLLGEPHTFKAQEPAVEIRFQSTDRAGWAEFGYLAWIPSFSSNSSFLTTDGFTLEKNGIQAWAVPVPEGVKRVDVWVFEQGETNRVYRIFTREPAL